MTKGMTQEVDQLWNAPTTAQLAQVLAVIADQKNMQDFLRDVLTEKEIIEISSRLEAAKMLQSGKKYAEIIDQTKLSSRTVARISDWLQNGQGGYQAALKIVNAQQSHIPPASAE